jgi:hypothetical protein
MIAETIMHNTSVHAGAASRSALAQQSAASAGRCVSADEPSHPRSVALFECPATSADGPRDACPTSNSI